MPANRKICDHADFTNGRCKDKPEYVVVTAGYPTWVVCAKHLESRVHTMVRVGKVEILNA